MDITRDNKNTEQDREIQNMVIQLIQLWITRLKFENEEDRLRKEIQEWEYENDELNYGEEQFDWEFRYEHV
tara:strand:+ start:317 stop:529 length:213 start_codon:yes stop_codon:yes gene_type:complete